ncbi:MAG: hypothetical protein V7L05_11595 [Nostoc sp.]|uniref:hypothetical protein n=1 Tax=Nostoc sp. TaxID=1180 RepID=UPI002FFBBAA6
MNTILISCTRRLEVTRQVQQEWLAGRQSPQVGKPAHSAGSPTHWLGYTGKTHLRGLKTLDFLLVHGRGREFV